MKYVDIESLTKKIDSLYDEWCGSSTGLEVAEEGAWIGAAESVFEEVRKIIESLQQEQTSFSSNLDEAAEKFARLYDNGTCDGIAQDCFKAGAEWQKAQDESRKRANIKLANTDIPIDADMEIAFNDLWLDAEVSIERDGNLDEELTEAMKALCHDFFESGKEWVLKAKEESK